MHQFPDTIQYIFRHTLSHETACKYIMTNVVPITTTMDLWPWIVYSKCNGLTEYCYLYHSLKKKSRELSSYPILEKVIMWVNIQCKVSLKIKGDYRKSIIYTAKRNWLKELGIYTNKELFFPKSKEIMWRSLYYYKC